MTVAFLLPGLILAAVGLLAFLVPESVWGALTSAGSKMREQSSVAVLLFFAGVAILGTALVIGGVRDTLRGRASMTWIATPATILESSLAEGREARTGRKQWTPVVRFRYEFGGATYEGRRLSFGVNTTPASADGTPSAATQFAVGAQVNAFVNRERPQDAVLVAGADPLMLLFAGIGIVLLLVGAYYLRMLAREWTPRDDLTTSGKAP